MCKPSELDERQTVDYILLFCSDLIEKRETFYSSITAEFFAEISLDYVHANT